jgi:acetyltransferase-like isoleucine patch superfamily enzyme
MTKLQKIMARKVQIPSLLRGRLLFLFTGFLLRLPLFSNSRIQLGKNVRLQRLRCLMAEAPNAKISVGDNSIIYEDALIEAYGNGHISIGNNTIIGRNKIIAKDSIEIGNNVVTSWDVFIQDYDPHPTNADLRAKQIELSCLEFVPRFSSLDENDQQRIDLLKLELSKWNPSTRPIKIDNNVWIGAQCTILKGANIGAGCIVAANSVVLSGDYPDNSLIAGNPAKVVKSLS